MMALRTNITYYSGHKRSLASEETSKEPIFPPHLTPAQSYMGIKSGRLMQGTFFASNDNFLEGSVFCGKILLQGRENPNRAINGDIVAPSKCSQKANGVHLLI